MGCSQPSRDCFREPLRIRGPPKTSCFYFEDSTHHKANMKNLIVLAVAVLCLTSLVQGECQVAQCLLHITQGEDECKAFKKAIACFEPLKTVAECESIKPMIEETITNLHGLLTSKQINCA